MSVESIFAGVEGTEFFARARRKGFDNWLLADFDLYASSTDEMTTQRKGPCHDLPE
jgi:hypothetical protein